jgi:hypothetical protein
MAFSDFTFPQVQQDLGLTVDEADLFSPIPTVSLREDFVTTITDSATIALAVNTDKTPNTALHLTAYSLVSLRGDV